MIQFRTYGKPPYPVAVIHGGPGAGGEMAPVARELCSRWGILEPIQTATTLEGQIEELITILKEHVQIPAVLVGYSWGAWLSWFVTARCPQLVRKLILISSGPFDERYVTAILQTRFARFTLAEQGEFNVALAALSQPDFSDKDNSLKRLGILAGKADDYAALPESNSENDRVNLNGNIYSEVWESAAALRCSGELLAQADKIRCPVTAIHGDFDPHPADGVRIPLFKALKDFRFILLDKCGHTPWREEFACTHFYKTLLKEIE
jgi:pimeloyl-ACP methyl ester carboxylesterase